MVTYAESFEHLMRIHVYRTPYWYGERGDSALPLSDLNA